MHDLWPEILATPISGDRDAITWTPNDKGFTLRLAWDAIREHGQKLPWTRFIWTRGIILRKAFYTWRAHYRGLPTHDILMRRGFAIVSRCTLYWCECETLDHLLWTGNFSKRIWDSILPGLHWDTPSNETLQGVVYNLIQKFMLRVTPIANQCQIACVFTGVVHSIWTERNKRDFDENTPPSRSRAYVKKFQT